MPDVPITFEEALDAVTAADIVMLRNGRGSDFPATFIGWEDEGKDDSPYLLAAGDGEPSVSLVDAKGESIGVRNGHRLHIRGQGEIRLYKAMIE